jgi:hypothetical protein
MLAKNRRSGEFFAMKRLKKSDIIKLRQVDHVISENTILADIEHPLLVSYNSIASIDELEGLEKLPSTAFTDYNLFSIRLGWTCGLHPGHALPVLLNVVHSGWRTFHLPSHGRKTQPGACDVSTRYLLASTPLCDDYYINTNYVMTRCSDAPEMNYTFLVSDTLFSPDPVVSPFIFCN